MNTLQGMNNLLAQVTPKDSIVNPAIPGGYNRPGVAGNVLLTEFIGNLLTTALGLASIILLVWIVWGGVEWLISGGEKQAIESARNRITNGIIGMIIVALAIAIFMFIGEILGINLLKVTIPLPGK